MRRALAVLVLCAALPDAAQEKTSRSGASGRDSPRVPPLFWRQPVRSSTPGDLARRIDVRGPRKDRSRPRFAHRPLRPRPRKARAVSVNHVVLEIGDIDAALASVGA